MTTSAQQLPLLRHVKSTHFVETLLAGDLDFHNADSQYASHNYHSFPAKFPPQLPAKFIRSLTQPGATVLDPMMGSATTLVEAQLAMRRGVGFDIDPLAVRLATVKTKAYRSSDLEKCAISILLSASHTYQAEADRLQYLLDSRWDSKSRKFIDYWFARTTQLELMALIEQIEQLEDQSTRTFFEVAFSSIIITKSGGVSLALDLAHTRPHRAKIVFDTDGRMLLGEQLLDDDSPRLKILTKRLRSAFEVFDRRVIKNLANLPPARPNVIQPRIEFGDAQSMALDDNSIDLIVTSPPYASNAIDYMRAHKFSLVWLGHSVDQLGRTRSEYIGGESTSGYEFVKLPALPQRVVDAVAAKDEKRGRVLHRYYSEMTRVLQEMRRVLKKDKAAIVVVGNSMMRGIDTQTGDCLAAIGRALGFRVPKIGVRSIDRNRRMLPASTEVDHHSQIQQRMHEEYVLAFVKQ